MRAKDLAITALILALSIAKGACSLEEPQPKLLPATMKSPGVTFAIKVRIQVFHHMFS